MEKIKVIVEKSPENYGAYIENVSGVIATVGDTIDEVKKKIHEAIDLHLEVLREDNYPIPKVFQGEYELVFELDKTCFYSDEELKRLYSDDTD